jgi:hypothetical protein
VAGSGSAAIMTSLATRVGSTPAAVLDGIYAEEGENFGGKVGT